MLEGPRQRATGKGRFTVSGEWTYWTLTAEFQEIGTHPDGRPDREWVVTFSDSQWVGWRQILGKLGSDGWELISAVVEEQGVYPSGQLSGHATAYRLFCKKPK